MYETTRLWRVPRRLNRLLTNRDKCSIIRFIKGASSQLWANIIIHEIEKGGSLTVRLRAIHWHTTGRKRTPWDSSVSRSITKQFRGTLNRIQPLQGSRGRKYKLQRTGDFNQLFASAASTRERVAGRVDSLILLYPRFSTVSPSLFHAGGYELAPKTSLIIIPWDPVDTPRLWLKPANGATGLNIFFQPHLIPIVKHAYQRMSR